MHYARFLLLGLAALVTFAALALLVLRSPPAPQLGQAQSSFYPISLSNIANNWLQGDYANPPSGDVTLGAVPFHIPEQCCQVWVSNGDGNCAGSPLDATLAAAA